MTSVYAQLLYRARKSAAPLANLTEGRGPGIVPTAFGRKNERGHFGLFCFILNVITSQVGMVCCRLTTAMQHIDLRQLIHPAGPAQVPALTGAAATSWSSNGTVSASGVYSR